MTREFEIPQVVQNKAAAAGAQAWLTELPERVAHLERLWDITVDNVYTEGTEAFVAAALCSDGSTAVLKVAIPRLDTTEVRHEATVLRLAAGDGCAALLAEEPEHHALLMEQLGPSLFDLDLPVTARWEILCDTASRLWRTTPDASLPTGAEKAAWLSDAISSRWTDLDQPCSERAVEVALAASDRRRLAHDDERSVLVHGDVHQWNVLQASVGFKLIDPDGLFAEPEYDLGVIMREDPIELMADSDPRLRARWLAQRCELDVEAVWDWGLIERVSTGLLCAEINLQPVGRQMLRAAEYAADA